MVKEVLYFKNEITGEIFSTREEAEQSEKAIDAVRIVDDIAKKHNFKNYDSLLEYLIDNVEKIRSARIRVHTRMLHHKGKRALTEVSLEELEENIDYLVDIALKQVNEFESNVVVFLDNESVHKEKITSFDPNEFIWNAYDPKTMYLDKVEKIDVGFYNYRYISYPTKEVIPIIDALKKWKIQDDSEFNDFIPEYTEELTDAEKYFALDSSGVDNWSGYDFALELAKDDGADWWELTPEEKLAYLYNAGVDNWSFYSDSLKEHSKCTDQNIVECFKDNEDYFAEHWSDYQNFKFTLHGIISE